MIVTRKHAAIKWLRLKRESLYLHHLFPAGMHTYGNGGHRIWKLKGVTDFYLAQRHHYDFISVIARTTDTHADEFDLAPEYSFFQIKMLVLGMK